MASGGARRRKAAPAPRSDGLRFSRIFFRAYSMGGGTYTGIEAVSNGLPILREPRTVTGKCTMLYMAFSLAFIAGGILICYSDQTSIWLRGQTLNAVLFEHIASQWRLIGRRCLITFTLLTEGALLFVAAQTGFIDGPRVLATDGATTVAAATALASESAPGDCGRRASRWELVLPLILIGTRRASMRWWSYMRSTCL